MSVAQYETLDELETYAEQAHSSIHYVLMELMEVPWDDFNPTIGSHIGVSIGLVTYLRALPYQMSKVRQKRDPSFCFPCSPKKQEAAVFALSLFPCNLVFYLQLLLFTFLRSARMPTASPWIYR